MSQRRKLRSSSFGKTERDKFRLFLERPHRMEIVMEKEEY
jgi:hypothetical protein